MEVLAVEDVPTVLFAEFVFFATDPVFVLVVVVVVLVVVAEVFAVEVAVFDADDVPLQYVLELLPVLLLVEL